MQRKMKELRSELPSGVEDSGPNDIFAQVVGPDKWGRVKMFGYSVLASDVCDGMPSRRACHRMTQAYQEEIENFKHVANEQNKQIEEQNKQIQEQNKQIQELLKMSKQRLESMESNANVTRPRSSTSHLPTACRPNSASSINGMSLRVISLTNFI